MDKITSENGATSQPVPSAEVAKQKSTAVEVRETEHKAINVFDNIDFFDEKELVKVKSFMGEYIKSSKNGGISTVQDAIAIAIRSKELGLPFTACAEHVHVINGKTGVDIHIIKGLLSRAGCTWKCLKDYQPLYEYTDGINQFVDGELPDYVVKCSSKAEADKQREKDINGDKMYVYPVRWYADVKGNKYPDYRLNTKNFAIVANAAQMQEAAANKLIGVWRIPNVPVDYITEYEISRNINGQIMTSKGRFTYKEAVVAGFFEKDTYIKYARIMIGNRAFTYAARDIGSDLLFGVMESTELKIVNNQNIDDKDFDDVEVVA
jgi:hypothetical protein